MTLIGNTDPADISITTANTTNDAAATHTHAVTASNAPGPTASLLQSSPSGGLTLEQLTINIQANLTKLLTTKVGSHLIPDLTDTYDLGTSTKLWRKGWISELEAVLFAQNTASILGGWFVIPKASGTLAADVGGVQTTIDFGQTMTLNDFVVLRTSLAVEYLQIGSLVSGTTYNITRNVDGSGANTWPSGMVYLVLGNTGNGRIELNAQGTPRISILEQGATYNAQTELIRLGDLDGNWGYASPTHGIALGKYAANQANLTWDATNGLRLRTYNSDVLQIDNAGNATLKGELNLGSAGGIYQGSGTFASPTTGLKIWNASGVGTIAGFNASVKQWYGETDGKFYFAGGQIAIGANGVEILGAENGTGLIEVDNDYWDGQFSEILRISHKIGNTATAVKHSEIILETQAFPTSFFDNMNFRIYSGWSSFNNPSSGFEWRNGTTGLMKLDDAARLEVYGDLALSKGLSIGYSAANPNDDAIYFYEGSTRLGDIKAQGSWLRINQDTNRNIYSPRMYRADQGFTAGAITNVASGGNIGYKGNLRPYRNSTYYTAYAYVPIAPSTSTNWNGDAKTASTVYTINLSEFSSVPNNAQAVNVVITVNLAGASWVRVGSSSTYPEEVQIEQGSGWHKFNGITRCVSGKFYFQAGTTVNNIWLTISGYWI